MKRLAVLLLLAALSTPAFAGTPQNDIRKTFAMQAMAWNRGDLAGYMKFYWNSPDLLFVTGDGITRGWQATFDRYKQRYQGEGREMGQLFFEVKAIDFVTPTDALVTGEWKLVMKDNKTPHGMFTVLMKKRKEGWRVVYDHSSAARD